MLQKVSMGEYQDGAVVSFYWYSTLYGYLLIFCWGFWYPYYILMLSPLPWSIHIPIILGSCTSWPVLLLQWLQSPDPYGNTRVPGRLSELYPSWHNDVWGWDFRHRNAGLLQYSPVLSVLFLCFPLSSYFRSQWRVGQAYLSLHNKQKKESSIAAQLWYLRATH